VDPQFIV
jgi:hypothetical protein